MKTDEEKIQKIKEMKSSVIKAALELYLPDYSELYLVSELLLAVIDVRNIDLSIKEELKNISIRISELLRNIVSNQSEEKKSELHIIGINGDNYVSVIGDIQRASNIGEEDIISLDDFKDLYGNREDEVNIPFGLMLVGGDDEELGDKECLAIYELYKSLGIIEEDEESMDNK